MKQTVLTFVAKVDLDKVSHLKELLCGMSDDVEHNTLIPFPHLKLLHFASLVITDDPGLDVYLVFENNFDGALDPYLEDLCTQATAGLHSIYSCCSDYSAASADKTQLLSYLRVHVQYPNAYHIGNVGRTVERIHREDALRDRLEDFLDGVVNEEHTESVGSIREKVQAFGRSEPGLAGTVQPRQTSSEHLLPRLKIIFAVLVALVLSPLLIPLLIIWVIKLRWTETHEEPPRDLDVNSHTKDLVIREDRTHIVQNHIAHISIVKPGAFRQATLRGVLWLVNLVARTQDNGKLWGIPSIHFAHWSLIDGRRRLLFLSNYDGSWQNYLDDFIDRVAFGLTAIWSNTVDFPRTRFLFFEGARDGPRFKAYTRDNQTYTNVWYSAYKQLTVEAIDNNTAIREDLFTSLNEAPTSDWLSRF